MINESDIEIGEIVSSNSHVDYVCEIYTDKMREQAPRATDFQFGQFVYLQQEIGGEEKIIVGLIYDTQIVNPEQRNGGPKLAQPEEQSIFQPSYVDQKQLLAGIVLLGHLTIKGNEITSISHSVPKWTLRVDDVVKKMSDEAMLQFHLIEEELQLQYYQRIIDIAEGLAPEILTEILTKLKDEYPQEAQVLDVIQKNLLWQTKMEGM